MNNINDNSSNIIDSYIIDTKLDKCQKCGSSDIYLNTSSGLLSCKFCKYEFQSEKLTQFVESINDLNGFIMGSGLKQIDKNANVFTTLKCSGCGAEIVLNQDETLQVKCHWCRTILTSKEKIENGFVPDAILPFNMSQQEAKDRISHYVSKRKFFANSKFQNEFNLENVRGVYFPYMLVDVNGHAQFVGKGEHELRSYFEQTGSGKNSHTVHYYDADLYKVERHFDIQIKDLCLESKLSNNNATSNILNAIMPFDIENLICFHPYYLRGFTSEKRDLDIDNLKEISHLQAKDIARIKINNDLKFYDRGICWHDENLDIKGQQWKAAYLPVWLYSYYQKNKNLLHYVALNSRTKEIIGSIPLNHVKLFFISSIIFTIVSIIGISIDVDFERSKQILMSLFAATSVSIVFYVSIYFRYRNSNVRHTYEKETFANICNIEKKDNHIKTIYRTTRSQIDNKNNTKIYGSVLNKANRDKIKSINIE